MPCFKSITLSRKASLGLLAVDLTLNNSTAILIRVKNLIKTKTLLYLIYGQKLDKKYLLCIELSLHKKSIFI